jgi:hypothetical protein
MGKLTNLDPKAQMALAAGGGVLAGAVMDHEIHEHTGPGHMLHANVYDHHNGGHHLLGSLTSLAGAAGLGALGAKFLGGKTQGGQPGGPPQGYPGAPMYGAPQYGAPQYGAQQYGAQQYGAQQYGAQQYGAQAYPPAGSPPGGPPTSGPGGLGGFGKLAAAGGVGLAGALAVGEGAHLLHHHHHNGSGPPPAGGPGVGGGLGSFLGGITHSGPGLNILAATYADKDVTAMTRQLVSSKQELIIPNMNEAFGDPWPEMSRKSFSVLYQYGNRPFEVWAGSSEGNQNTFNQYNKNVNTLLITHEGLANERMAYVNKQPGRVISLIWGVVNILTPEHTEKLERDGELDAKDLGTSGDMGWFGGQHTLVCYYRASHGGIGIAHAREGGTLRLPWNPYAQWA